MLRENEKHDILKRKPIFFKTIASVNRIINPINSHNVMASPSPKREGREEKEKEKDKKNLAETSQIIPPFKNNCFDPYDSYEKSDYLDSNTGSTTSKWRNPGQII